MAKTVSNALFQIIRADIVYLNNSLLLFKLIEIYLEKYHKLLPPRIYLPLFQLISLIYQSFRYLFYT